LFLNGLPLVVVEAKDFEVAEPLSEAYLQVTRYANTREDDYGVKEAKKGCFIITCSALLPMAGKHV
jgi:type I restriction enzyme R subunit